MICRYALRPEELRPLCIQFIHENSDKLQLSIFRKHLNHYRESVDEYFCNTPTICPNGWKPFSQRDHDYMEDEL